MKKLEMRKEWNGFKNFLNQIQRDGIEYGIEYVAENVPQVLKVLSYLIETSKDKEILSAAKNLLKMMYNTDLYDKELDEEIRLVDIYNHNDFNFDNCEVFQWWEEEFNKAYKVFSKLIITYKLSNSEMIKALENKIDRIKNVIKNINKIDDYDTKYSMFDKIY